MKTYVGTRRTYCEKKRKKKQKLIFRFFYRKTIIIAQRKSRFFKTCKNKSCRKSQLSCKLSTSKMSINLNFLPETTKLARAPPPSLITNAMSSLTVSKCTITIALTATFSLKHLYEDHESVKST